MKKYKPVPCAHIADYYDFLWLTQGPQLGSQLLRRGYREWAEGRVSRVTQQINNLYGNYKRRPPTSVKQILVRDFNWRMGNLRRWYGGKYVFDADIQEMIDIGIGAQMGREKERHQLRLWGEDMNLQSFDEIHENARHKLWYERYKADR